jgi:hypothetical protein
MFTRRKGKDGKSKKKGANDEADQQPAKPRWTDAWARTSVEPEEVHELVKRCTEEIKSRGMPPASRLDKPSTLRALRGSGLRCWMLHQLSPLGLVQLPLVPWKLTSCPCSSRSAFPVTALQANFRSQRSADIYTSFLRQLCTSRRDIGAGAADG